MRGVTPPRSRGVEENSSSEDDDEGAEPPAFEPFWHAASFWSPTRGALMPRGCVAGLRIRARWAAGPL
jgi:hypothetical protein